MTLGATPICMAASQRKRTRVHILAYLPIGNSCVVTRFARNGKPSHGMTGICGLLIILQMARHACRLKSGHLPVRVTSLAIKLRMAAYEWESRHGVLALHRHSLIPAFRRVALLAAVSKLPSVNIGMTGHTRSLSIRENQRSMAG